MSKKEIARRGGEKERKVLRGVKWKDNIDLKKETLLHALIYTSHLTIFVFSSFLIRVVIKN